MIRLFHRTTFDAAQGILRDGFRDTTDTYMTDRHFTGVWLSDRPLDGNEGAAGDTLLQVDLRIAAEELAGFEWIEEGKPYREFLIPAEFINGRSTVQTAQQEDDSHAT